MVFHVTLIGPSFCEIQYTSSEETDADAAAGGTGPLASLSWDYCFLAEITLTNLKEDTLHLPVAATRWAALNCECQVAILVNKEGDSWRTNLAFDESLGTYYIRGGWARFCRDNRADIGNLFMFDVVGDGKTPPLLCVCLESEECRRILRKYGSRKTGECSHG